MAPLYHDDAGHNAPEVTPQQSYLYAVSNDAPSQPPIPTKEPYYHAQPPLVETPAEPTRIRQGWKRWWILAMLGLFIALIAGLVGGFIGQAIQKGRESSDSPTSSPTPSASPSNGNSTATTPPPNAPPGTVGTIVLPESGCNFPASRAQRRIANETVYSRKSYTIICNSGWSEPGGQDDILALWTLTPSDCIEACISHNAAGSNQRSCKGGGFIPSWTDRNEAAKVLNGPPKNCFLKNSTTGIGANDREVAGVEVVALCMQGQCSGIGTS
ncbi:hypothetical protein IQ06DRAFT_296123 [Phaeosphaeriaceae sp. SRC1lsM3a]|nr:hypothetical protein IQ06DRAFT_296123 [Stagonospora sp. SRC1lsM3a]